MTVEITNVNKHSKINSWFLAARPKTLAAAFVPILVGTALAFSTLKQTGNEKVVYLYSILAFLSAVFIQIGTNLINDALDFKKGADTESRIGPKRVTQSGLLSMKQVLLGGFLSFLIALLLGLPLVLHAGLPIFILGVVSLFFGYLYTGGRYPLAYVGLGELFVILFFGLGAVCGVHYIQTGIINAYAIVASLQVGFLATTLISINNFRDYINDKVVNKLTLAARFGKKFARAEIICFFTAAYLLNIYWLLNQHIVSGLLPFISLPITIKVIKGLLQNEPSPLFNKFLGMAAGIQMIFGVALSIGLFIY